MIELDQQTYDRISRLAIAGAALAESLREVVGQHPSDCDSELVVPVSEIEELLLTHHEQAFVQKGNDDAKD